MSLLEAAEPRVERPPNRMRALMIPPVVWVIWLALMIYGDKWFLFIDNWFMTVTMCFGSFIAGATSEGGGAVAFPVMTLLFDIRPSVARDFSLIIQSAGMTAAGLTILWLGIRVEWRAVLYAGLGGSLGIILCLDFIAPYIPPQYVKMFFTSLWLSFGLTLFWLNRHRDRKTHDGIERFRSRHAYMLFGVGIIGGAISGLTGSGLDIVTFTMLTLFFRVCEKIATPTSVVLMGINAFVGSLWAGGVQQNLHPDAWAYWYVCVPVCVVGAPLGAWFISSRTRNFIVKLLCASIVVQFVASLLIIPQTPQLVTLTVVTLTTGLLVFRQLTKAGTTRQARLSLPGAEPSLTGESLP